MIKRKDIVYRFSEEIAGVEYRGVVVRGGNGREFTAEWVNPKTRETEQLGIFYIGASEAERDAKSEIRKRHGPLQDPNALTGKQLFELSFAMDKEEKRSGPAI
jgi:hypothetical protein